MTKFKSSSAFPKVLISIASFVASTSPAQSHVSNEASSEASKPAKKASVTKIEKSTAGKPSVTKKNSKKPVKESAPAEEPLEIAPAEPFNRDQFQSHLADGPKIDSTDVMTFDITPSFGFGTRKRIEGSIFAGLVILPDGLPMPINNNLALEIGAARAKWDKDIVAENRFSLIGDVRWSVKAADSFVPYIGLGVSMNRTWETAKNYNSATESRIRPHVKVGSFLKISGSTALRLDFDPTLEVLRVGLALSF